jgi:predicted GNAT family acetyltransferase
MPLVTTTEPAQVRSLCNAVVAADPLAGTIFATIAEWTMRDEASGWAAYLLDRPQVLVARSHTDTPVTFTPGWSAADLAKLAPVLADLEPSAASLAGPTEIVESAANRLGYRVTDRHAERLYRLDDLVEPAGVVGRARLAVADDVDFLTEWYVDFYVETFGRLAPGYSARTRDMVRHGVTGGRCWLWLDDLAAARAFAVRRPAVNGVSRVGPVYTPPAWRGRGYGSAATAAATRAILDEGAVPCLYTDLANPTSNKIYRAIGYYPVLDRTMIRFD